MTRWLQPSKRIFEEGAVFNANSQKLLAVRLEADSGDNDRVRRGRRGKDTDQAKESEIGSRACLATSANARRQAQTRYHLE